MVGSGGSSIGIDGSCTAKTQSAITCRPTRTRNSRRPLRGRLLRAGYLHVKPYEAVPRRAQNLVGCRLFWRPHCLHCWRRLSEESWPFRRRGLCDSVQNSRHGGSHGSRLSGTNDSGYARQGARGVQVFSPRYIQPNYAMNARFNRFVDWTRNGGPRFCHSSQLSAPLWSTHGQR